jgi:hypothetical protein
MKTRIGGGFSGVSGRRDTEQVSGDPLLVLATVRLG